ncbi:hypothetical protein Tco_0908234 [Tanacetum coccineum]|uniref:Uncharacterized protein n=1 Tax=Tanacetum coccineum TaxID=301880 RepID=A0ABQ5CT08_9ASTR
MRPYQEGKRVIELNGFFRNRKERQDWGTIIKNKAGERLVAQGFRQEEDFKHSKGLIYNAVPKGIFRYLKPQPNLFMCILKTLLFNWKLFSIVTMRTIMKKINFRRCQYLGRRLVSGNQETNQFVGYISTEPNMFQACKMLCSGGEGGEAGGHEVGRGYAHPDLIGPWLQQFWATATLQVINDVPHIRAKVAGKKILISEATIRADLLFDDENGVDCFPKQVIWDTLREHRYGG